MHEVPVSHSEDKLNIADLAALVLGLSAKLNPVAAWEYLKDRFTLRAMVDQLHQDVIQRENVDIDDEVVTTKVTQLMNDLKAFYTDDFKGVWDMVERIAT